jgi:hypothetical protein
MPIKKSKRQAKEYSYYEYLQKFQPQSLPDERQNDCRPFERRTNIAFGLIRDSRDSPASNHPTRNKRDSATVNSILSDQKHD